MRKKGFERALTGLVLCAAMIIGSLPFTAMPANAAVKTVATVHGTVEKGTNSSTLYLNTKEGDMIIKIDSDTDTSSCKLMLTGSTVYASVYYGSDSYMHASALSSSESGASSASTSSSATVTGTIEEKDISDGIMYVNTSSGEMHVKLDDSTSYNCGPLYAGKGISMQVARGSDAYMHALKISDYSAADTTTATSATSSTTSTTSTQSSTASTSSTTSSGVKTTAVTGTVGSATKAGTGIVYLNASDGEYILKLDADTDFSNGFLLIAGQKITANIYYSSGYWHAASFTRVGSQSSTASGTTTMSFSGTVAQNTTESMLYLSTSGGTMTIKLDSNTSFTAHGPVTLGRSITVKCTNCSDGYWHASSISLN